MNDQNQYDSPNVDRSFVDRERLSKSATYSRGIKGIDQKIHRDRSHATLDRRGGDTRMTGGGLELDSPIVSHDEFQDQQEMDSFYGKNETKSPIKIRNFREGLTSSKKKMIKSHTKQGQEIQVNLEIPKQHKLRFGELPETLLDQGDYNKRLKFEELKKIKLESMCHWKQKDTIGIKKNAYIKEIQKKNEKILSVADKNELEKLEVMTDRFPLLKLRKAIYKFIVLLNMVSKAIISTAFFDNFTTSVILFNCVTMMLNNPIDPNPPQFFADIESVFLVLYTGEMVLKILGMGFIIGETSYLRDSWNILDFLIVMTSLLSLGGSEEPQISSSAQEDSSQGGFNVQSFRAFRVMRPLRTISSIKGLKVLMTALISAIPLLGDTLTILFGFFLTFAIAGCQLFTGVLKNRCFDPQTGWQVAGLSLCSSNSDCAGNQYCGKSNSNPNNGATNFDNVLYSLLVVFQTTTLEGWSDVQVQIEQAYSVFVPVIYFTMIVFAGAFFLLNLTLAVINSKFTEAHNAHQSSESKVNQQTAVAIGDEELDLQQLTKDDMSISQFITARIYAKKMIEFLRMRQEIKRIERERMVRIKEKQKLQDENKKKDASKHRVSVKTQIKPQQKAIDRPKPPVMAQIQKGVQIAKQIQKIEPTSGIIPEDPKAEELDDGGENNHALEVQNFFKQGIQNMQRQGQITKNMNFPTRIQVQAKAQGPTNNYNDQSFGIEIETAGNGKPVMKGNIGPTKKFQINNTNLTQKQKDKWQKFGSEFDIDNIIPQHDGGHGKISNPSDFGIDLNSNRSYNFSGKHEDLESNFPQSQRSPSKKNKFGRDLPDLTQGTHMTHGDESGLITSDSDFEKAVDNAGYKSKVKEINNDASVEQTSIELKAFKAFNIKRDISKTFKRMLTSNHNRSSCKPKESDDNVESTHYDGSIANKQHSDQVTQMSELERKFIKKKTTFKPGITKLYKEDDNIAENFLEANYVDQQGPMLKTKKEDIRQLQEFVTTKRPKDPFKDLEPLKQKVDITKGLKYLGTSQNEIFEGRILNHQKENIMAKNPFIKLPQSFQDEKKQAEVVNDAPIRTEFAPYQQKVFYQIEPDSSDIDEDSQSTDEDVLFAAEQPFMTPTNINYSKWTNQLYIPDIMKRSDIMITSTLAMSIFPKDQRDIQKQYFGLMTQRQIEEYIDEKNAFKSLVKEHQYQIGEIKEKDKKYAETYMKSFIYQNEFTSKSMKNFKARVANHNLTKKVPPPKSKEIIKNEKFKHEQNKRASQKRGLPKFDMDQAKKLLSGKFHEDEDDDDIDIKPANQTVHGAADVNSGLNNQVHSQEQIIKALHQIFEKDEELGKKHTHDEIPTEIRKKYGLPKQMGIYEVDFDSIRLQDISFKKQLPMWSGQDVLRDRIDNSKSYWISVRLNGIRVWPLGMLGIWKKFRFYLRVLEKSALFDNLMTFCVLLNTIVLGLDHYGISTEMSNMNNVANTWFTYIFITEMIIKLVAIGFHKYCADKMNYLDGFVVILSVIEIVISEILIEMKSVNLSGFKTLRMMRAFRVFRIARLLKALQSMQTIISVISKSYMSFFYIAMLMFLFIIIFSLLGSEMFGGKIIGSDPNDPNTKPRGNFDSFDIALITVFQILTMENWQQVLQDSFYGQGSGRNLLSVAYFMLWIFLGNFILLNLFLAILLDSFLEESDEIDEDELAHLRYLKKQRKAEKQLRKNKNKVFMGENNERKLTKKQDKPSNLYFGQKPDSDEDLEDLDEEQIREIFKEQNIIKQDQKDIDKRKPYEDKHGKILVFCENSFYLFHKQNKLRLFMYKSINTTLWDNIVMFLIFLSSMKLAFDSYTGGYDDNDPIIIYSGIADNAFNVLFIIEMASKLIALGIIMDGGSYLRDSWNQLDFFIVMASVVDMSLSSYKIGFVKILRALRVLRPLRMIAHNPELKMIINALLDSMGSIMNVLIVIAVVYLIFAIIGVNLFSGRFFYCTQNMYVYHTQIECEMHAGLWIKYDFNYDNAMNAMETLYVVSSLEGWPDIMIQTIDMTSIDKGPLRDNSLPYYWYYIIFIFIGSFFFLNFFIGVLFMKFNQARKEDNKGFTTVDLAWLDIQKLILSAEPDYETTNVPRNDSQRKKFHDLVSSSQFEKFIMMCIVLNIIQMSLNQENLTPGMAFALDFSGNIFTFIFLVECILKLIAYGQTYFKNSWNQFDFIVVSSSLFDIFIQFLDSIEADLSTLSSLTQLARIARILRVTRILKLAGKDPGLQAILQTIQFSIPSLANVLTLLVLIYFMFAVIGNFAFQDIIEGVVVDPVYKNFRGFHQAFLLVFALSTGEDWNLVMYDCNRTTHSPKGCIQDKTCNTGNIFLGKLYFFLLVFVCSHVMLNLFILVIIQQFEHYYLQKDNSINNYKNDLISFMKVWKKWTQDRYQCKKIKEGQLVNFFRELGEFGSKEESLGFSEEFYDTGELKKQLLKMGIKANGGFVYFNELLYRCMRRKYGAMKINKKMQIIELKNQIKIFEMGREMQTDGKKISKEDIVQSIAGKVNGYNPFLAVMNFKISVKTWIKHARKNVKNMKKLKKEERGELDSCSDEEDEPIEQYTIKVEIEVEQMYSETDEEDEEELMLGLSSAKKKSSQSRYSPNKVSENESPLSKKKTIKRDMDHLSMFKRKMTKKFRNQKLLKEQSQSQINMPRRDNDSSQVGLIMEEKKLSMTQISQR